MFDFKETNLNVPYSVINIIYEIERDRLPPDAHRYQWYQEPAEPANRCQVRWIIMVLLLRTDYGIFLTRTFLLRPRINFGRFILWCNPGPFFPSGTVIPVPTPWIRSYVVQFCHVHHGGHGRAGRQLRVHPGQRPAGPFGVSRLDSAQNSNQRQRWRVRGHQKSNDRSRRQIQKQMVSNLTVWQLTVDTWKT